MKKTLVLCVQVMLVATYVDTEINVMIQSLLADRNECADSPCHVSASCINTIGSFHCFCNEGFLGDGFECKGSTIHAL